MIVREKDLHNKVSNRLLHVSERMGKNSYDEIVFSSHKDFERGLGVGKMVFKEFLALQGGLFKDLYKRADEYLSEVHPKWKKSSAYIDGAIDERNRVLSILEECNDIETIKERIYEIQRRPED